MKQSGAKPTGPGRQPARKFSAKRGGNNKSTLVTPGDGWRMFAQPHNDLEYLGTIQRGLEIGALARDLAGHYLQVNGDIRQTLNASRVETALRAAKPRAPSYVPRPAPTPSKPVVVTVKPRRRVIVPPT